MNEAATTTESREREFLGAYVKIRNQKELLEANLSATNKELESAKNKLVDYLNDMGKKSTGSYADLGSVLITEPIMGVKVSEESKAKQFEYLKATGAAAVIKENVHHATFASLIRERSEKGEQIPDFIEISYIPQVKYSRPKS